MADRYGRLSNTDRKRAFSKYHTEQGRAERKHLWYEAMRKRWAPPTGAELTGMAMDDLQALSTERPRLPFSWRFRPDEVAYPGVEFSGLERGMASPNGPVWPAAAALPPGWTMNDVLALAEQTGADPATVIEGLNATAARGVPSGYGTHPYDRFFGDTPFSKPLSTNVGLPPGLAPDFFSWRDPIQAMVDRSFAGIRPGALDWMEPQAPPPAPDFFPNPNYARSRMGNLAVEFLPTPVAEAPPITIEDIMRNRLRGQAGPLQQSLLDAQAWDNPQRVGPNIDVEYSRWPQEPVGQASPYVATDEALLRSPVTNPGLSQNSLLQGAERGMEIAANPRSAISSLLARLRSSPGNMNTVMEAVGQSPALRAIMSPVAAGAIMASKPLHEGDYTGAATAGGGTAALLGVIQKLANWGGGPAMESAPRLAAAARLPGTVLGKVAPPLAGAGLGYDVSRQVTDNPYAQAASAVGVGALGMYAPQVVLPAAAGWAVGSAAEPWLRDIGLGVQDYKPSEAAGPADPIIAEIQERLRSYNPERYQAAFGTGDEAQRAALYSDAARGLVNDLRGRGYGEDMVRNLLHRATGYKAQEGSKGGVLDQISREAFDPQRIVGARG